MRRGMAHAALAALLLTSVPVLAQSQPAAPKAAAVSKFLSPGDLDPATLLPPPPKDDAPAGVEGRAELHRIAAVRTASRPNRPRRSSSASGRSSTIRNSTSVTTAMT